MSSDSSFGKFDLFELFQQEAESQCATLAQELVELENDPSHAGRLEALMRAAHSLKGAARIVGVEAAVTLAHVMEDCFVAAQNGAILLHAEATDLLLRSTDLLRQISATPESDLARWNSDPALAAMVSDIHAIIKCELPASPPLPTNVPADVPAKVEAEAAPPAPEKSEKPEHSPAPSPPSPSEARRPPASAEEASDRVLRVSARSLNRLLGLAGEALVESRWVVPHAEALLRLKRQQQQLIKQLEILRETLADESETTRFRVGSALSLAADGLQQISNRYDEVEERGRRAATLSRRLYDVALSSRMRPFSDATAGLPRLVRDLARELGKEVRFEIEGQTTPVDRDVLERLEAPLHHLLRNAIDHGLETPDQRGEKPRTGHLRLEARHLNGQLQIIIEDDGQGVHLDALRRTIVARELSSDELVARMSEAELLDFLFLPGFTMRERVTQISGRGVGLDTVADMVRSVGGSIRVHTGEGRGTRFTLQLPLTLSVLRALLVEIGGEAYAFPLVRIQRAVCIPESDIETLEGREHATLEGEGGRRLGLVSATQLLGKPSAAPSSELSVVVVGDRDRPFGVVVDRFLGEYELVVQPLDPRLGKVKDISAGAVMPDGSPALVIDIDDLLRSIEALSSGGTFSRLPVLDAVRNAATRKRVLVVDDSLTVRELERKLLVDAGYDVEVAVDGMDGWNAARTQSYDLILTDIDMPRLDGIELVRLIKHDTRLRSLPVMIVSYKDRPEDRHRGLEAGADYYLTKGSFHDETLLQAVADLIGRADEDKLSF